MKKIRNDWKKSEKCDGMLGHAFHKKHTKWWTRMKCCGIK